MGLDYSKISQYTGTAASLPKKITDVTDSIYKGAESVAKMTSKMDAAVTKAGEKTKNKVSGAIVGGAGKITGGLDSLAQRALGAADIIKEKGSALSAKAAEITKAAALIKQYEGALKTTQAVIGTSSQLVNAVVNSVSGHLHPRSNEKIFTAFDGQWDAWAATINNIYKDLSPLHQENILADLAKEKFGNNVFALGSAIKNESAGIFGGIADFEDALHAFRGSYRNPIEAAAKIEQGVKGIVRATERVANSINNMIKTWQGRNGTAGNGNPVLTYLGNLHDTKIVGAINATLSVANAAAPLAADGKALAAAVKSKNPLAIYGAAKTTVEDVKKVVNSVKGGAGALKNVSGSLGSASANTSAGAASQIGGGASAANGSGGAGDAAGQAAETEENNDSSGKTDSYVCSKAKIRCTNGDKISTLTVLPDRTIWLTGEPQANISDHRSMVNIAPFGKCRTTAYPPTGAATAAAHGKLTPMPCVPNTPFPWMNGKDDVLLKGDPALLKSSKCKCIYGGTITITFDGQSPKIGETNSKAPKLEGSKETSKVKIELHLLLIFDGYNTDAAQDKTRERFEKGEVVKTQKDFKLNLLVSGLDNPSAKISPNEDQETPQVIHQVFKIKLDEKNLSSKSSYLASIRKATKNIQNFVYKYIIQPDVESIDLHFTVVTLNQEDMLTKIAGAIEGKDLEKEIIKTFDFKLLFNNYKIKYCKADSISVIDVMGAIAGEAVNMGISSSKLIFGSVLKAASITLNMTTAPLRYVMEKALNSKLGKIITGRGNLEGETGLWKDNGIDSEHYPTRERFSVFDAAVICQHTYDSQGKWDKSVFAKEPTSPVNQKKTEIEVDSGIESNVRTNLTGNSPSKDELTGTITTQAEWIPTNEDDEIMAKSPAMINRLIGFHSKLYKRTEGTDITEYVYCTAGTEPSSFNDWVFTNFLQGITGLSAQYTQSVRVAKYLDKYCSENKSRLFFTGHSLGGGLASNNTIVTKQRHSIIFNAAGLNPLRIAATLLLNNPNGYFHHDQRANRIHSIVIDGEILNKLLGPIKLGAMSAEKGITISGDTKIAIPGEELNKLAEAGITVESGDPTTKIGRLSALNRHSVINILRIKELQTIELQDIELQK